MTPCSRAARAAGAWLLVSVLAALALSATGTSEAAATATCTSFGPTWSHTYNKRAAEAGNPVRIVAACCKRAVKAGVHSCYVTVTLAGTTDRGCESVDIGKSGLPVGPGKHEDCLLEKA